MTDYTLLLEQTKSLLEGESHPLPALANVSALLSGALPEINWSGFYLMEGGSLMLGPFQGRPACVRIAPGCGVCGTAVKEDRVQLVPDVHRFPGHIACDSASNSEIVLPLHFRGSVIGVLDIDSPAVNRFTQTDRDGLLEIIRVLELSCGWDLWKL